MAKIDRQKSKQTVLPYKQTNIEKPVLPIENGIMRLRYEFAVLGFLCDRHPMMLYTDLLKKNHTIKIKNLLNFKGKFIYTAGILITGKIVQTKHGDPMEFLTFEDETGLLETTFFPKTYHRFCTILNHGFPFILYGKIEEDFGALTMTVSHVKRL